MKAFVAVIIFFVAVSADSPPTAQRPNKIKALIAINECLYGFNIDPEIFKYFPNAPLATPHQEGCYYACKVRAYKLAKANGMPNFDVIFKESETDAHAKTSKSESEKKAAKCKESAGVTDICKFYQCFFEVSDEKNEEA